MSVTSFPELLNVALDATDTRGLAEFYRELLGLHYRAGDEAPDDGPDDADWLVLLHADGRRALAVNRVQTLPRSTWPAEDVPKQIHLDFRVDTVEDLQRQRARAEGFGAVLVLDRSDDADEPLYVLADPAGHPFCILVSPG